MSLRARRDARRQRAAEAVTEDDDPIGIDLGALTQQRHRRDDIVHRLVAHRRGGGEQFGMRLGALVVAQRCDAARGKALGEIAEDTVRPDRLVAIARTGAMDQHDRRDLVCITRVLRQHERAAERSRADRHLDGGERRCVRKGWCAQWRGGERRRREEQPGDLVLRDRDPDVERQPLEGDRDGHHHHPIRRRLHAAWRRDAAHGTALGHDRAPGPAERRERQRLRHLGSETRFDGGQVARGEIVDGIAGDLRRLIRAQALGAPIPAPRTIATTAPTARMGVRRRRRGLRSDGVIWRASRNV